jgi:hypothetical protein
MTDSAVKKHGRHILITLPSGVGKTMNLSMAKMFLECLNDERKRKSRDALFQQSFEHELVEIINRNGQI